MAETRSCHWCERLVPKEEFCPFCLAKFPERPLPETMTADERVAEIDALRYCEVPFPLIHERIERLVGRPVWTHEMTTSGVPLLQQEARWEGRPATMDEVLAKIPEGKQVIAVEVPGAH